MPGSFKDPKRGIDKLEANFGESAIGRITTVDSGVRDGSVGSDAEGVVALFAGRPDLMHRGRRHSLGEKKRRWRP
jgi:hypothetical protein